MDKKLTGHPNFVSCIAVLNDQSIVSGSYRCFKVWPSGDNLLTRSLANVHSDWVS